nr:hypothetical protein [Elizabethkingia sp. ASV34]
MSRGLGDVYKRQIEKPANTLISLLVVKSTKKRSKFYAAFFDLLLIKFLNSLMVKFPK